MDTLFFFFFFNFFFFFGNIFLENTHRMKKNHEAMAMEVAGVKTSQDKMAAEVAELKAMVAELLGHAKNNGSV